MKRLLTYLWLLLLGIPRLTIGQHSTHEPLPPNLKEAGYPIIQNYSPTDYDAFDQNWGFAQDSLGRIYVANGDGVLVYDGVSWDLLSLPNNGSVFALDVDQKGTIYVGAHNEVGYLASDSIGQLTYVSLMHFVDEADKDFNIIWHCFTTDEGIYFSSRTKLFRWDGTKFLVWRNESSPYQRAFKVGNSIWLLREGTGLMQLKNDKFQLVSGGSFLAEEKISTFLAYDKQQLLIGTHDKLYIYDGTNFKPFKTDRPDFFADNKISCAAQLRDSTFALGSRSKGVLVIDREGRQRTILSQDGLLQSNYVLSLFQDQSGILWAALFSGISKIEYPTPFSIFGENSKIRGTPLKILRHKKKIYAGTSQGLFVYNRSVSDAPFFNHLSEINGITFDMIRFQDKLIVGALGIYTINGEVRNTNTVDRPVHDLLRSQVDTNRVFVGLSPGLLSIYYKDGRWVREKEFDEVTFAVHTIAENITGDLWLRTNANNVVRMSFESKSKALELEDPQLMTYDQDDGFPDDVGVPYLYEGSYFFVANTSDIYRFDPQTDRFILDRSLYNDLGLGDKEVKINHIDDQGNIWLIDYKQDKKWDQLVAWKQEDGTFEVESLQESRIMDLRRNDLFAEWQDNVVWYEGKSGIIRHDLNDQGYQIQPQPTVLISKVSYKMDSLLFAGHGQNTSLSLPYKNNSFRFQFASPGFYQETANQYQVYLDGFDQGWSDWINEPQKDYTNVPEGNYTFRVRSQNIFGQISPEATYSFTLSPPWYRTWWAYCTYLIMAIALVLLIVRLRSSQLRKEKKALEEMIAERTEEIREKNNQLAEQTEKLKEVDHVKSRLFANISHEFRTPLTLIKGPIDQLVQHSQQQLSQSNIGMIYRNTDRLLRLVNQLLDLSKLDAGSLKLELAEGNTFKCLRAAASSFSSHAAQRNLDYQIKIPSRLLWTSFDRDKLEKVVYNLLSNAFKFTHDEGTIIITANHNNDRLWVQVKDTGRGIPQAKLNSIFDRFYQVDNSQTRDQEGSGIGLALTKELVTLMGGTIDVMSAYGQGSQFQVNLPLQQIKISKEDPTPATDAFDVDNFSTDAIPKPPLIPNLSDPEMPTIMIVEDNVDMRDYIGQHLISSYRIVEATNGEEGLKQARDLIPDLIITDLMMPQMDGTEMSKCLRTDQRTSHIPIIMLTAKAGLQNKIEGLDVGADDYLVKPFEARELQARVNNLISQRRKLRELFSSGVSLDPKQVTVTSIDEQFLQKTLDLLEERYAEPEFGVPQMQGSLALSKTQLHRKLRALINQSPGELLRNFRLKRAAQLLAQNENNVTQIAFSVGFNSSSYFARCFKEYHGVTPTAYAFQRR